MTHKGTFLYQAPEISRAERYGFAADIFSFGITMYEVCNKVRKRVRRTPFESICILTRSATVHYPTPRTFPTRKPREERQ